MPNVSVASSNHSVVDLDPLLQVASIWCFDAVGRRHRVVNDVSMVRVHDDMMRGTGSDRLKHDFTIEDDLSSTDRRWTGQQTRGQQDQAGEHASAPILVTVFWGEEPCPT